MDRMGAEKKGKRSRKLRSGKRETSRYVLARSMERGISLSSYPQIFPLIENRSRWKRTVGLSSKRFSDFAPLLLLNRASAETLSTLVKDKRNSLSDETLSSVFSQESGSPHYPLMSFRGNLVVSGAGPWAEELWGKVRITNAKNPSSPVVILNKIKECPRCTIPCRDQSTGKYLFPPKPLTLWDVLKSVFPSKATDPDWGIWAGVFFGVYMTYDAGTFKEIGEGAVGKKVGGGSEEQEEKTFPIIHVGDTVEVMAPAEGSWTQSSSSSFFQNFLSAFPYSLFIWIAIVAALLAAIVGLDKRFMRIV